MSLLCLDLTAQLRREIRAAMEESKKDSESGDMEELYAMLERRAPLIHHHGEGNEITESDGEGEEMPVWDDDVSFEDMEMLQKPFLH